MISRRAFTAGLAGSTLALATGAPTLSRPAFASSPLASAGDLLMHVAKSPTCGCCAGWIAHVQAEGFSVQAFDLDQDDLAAAKVRVGVPVEAASCHTALIDRYFLEGHVPADDIRRLLRERPDVRGLAVPGMPAGSPGMEMGDLVDAYDTLLVAPDGSTTVFARHGR